MILPEVSDGDFQTLRIKRDGLVLHVTIDHPPINTVDDTVHNDFCRLFALLRHETTARAILLTGAGKVFCAGAHFDWLPTLRGPERLDTVRRHAKQLVYDFLDVEVPIVAALNGPALGFGASIALLCDIIFMAESAVIADPHVQIGVVAGDSGTFTWPLAIGPARAKEYLMTGDRVTSSDAYRMGMVNRVVPDDEILEQATAFAHRLAAGPPLATRATKLCVNKLIKQAMSTAFETATAMEMLTFYSEDHVEAVAAVREGRPGQFHGR